MLDSAIKIATCNRCGAVVLAASVSGCATAADTQPLGVDQYRAALIAGRVTFDVITQAGRPWKLRTRGPSVPTSGLAIVAAHSCGAAGRDATGVTELPEDPRQARVSATGHPDLFCASETPQAGSQSLSPVPGVIPRRIDLSDRPHRCQICRCLIEDGEPYWAIDHERMHWAQHDDCP